MDPAIETWMQKHGRRVYRAARAACRDPDEAEDVLQAVFMRIVADPELKTRIAGMARPGGYLATMARNLVRDRQRARARERRAIERRPRPDSDAPAGPLLDRDGLLAAVAALPDAERRAVTLRYLMGRSTRETAALLGVSESTVGVNLHRGLDRLRRHHAKDINDEQL